MLYLLAQAVTLEESWMNLAGKHGPLAVTLVITVIAFVKYIKKQGADTRTARDRVMKAYLEKLAQTQAEFIAAITLLHSEHKDDMRGNREVFEKTSRALVGAIQANTNTVKTLATQVEVLIGAIGNIPGATR